MNEACWFTFSVVHASVLVSGLNGCAVCMCMLIRPV